MNRLIISLFLLLSISFVHSEEERISSIGYSSVEDALEDLKTNSNASIRVEGGWTIVQVQTDSEMALWSFTPSTHPAHPAAIKRNVYEKDGAVWIDMAALCQATKIECDKLIQQFEELNEQIKRNMSGGA